VGFFVKVETNVVQVTILLVCFIFPKVRVGLAVWHILSSFQGCIVANYFRLLT